MNVLFVYPRFPHSFWGFQHALPFVFKKAVIPPLGLLTVAGLLPPAWGKRLVDMNTAALEDTDLIWADLVMISAMHLQAASCREVIARARCLGKRVAAGGPLFTTNPEKFPEVDFLILQEAELTLPAFLQAMEKRDAPRTYTTTQWADLTRSPLPDWDLVRIEDYFMLGVQYTRGCPFDCEFCHVTGLFGRIPRTKTVEQVLAELDVFYRRGWREQVMFVDDNFIGRRQQLKQELLPALIRWMQERRYPFSFFTQASINLADDEELMRLMAQAGFNTVFVGIETTHEPSLQGCRKQVNQDRNLVACVRKIHAHGMQVQGGFILGFDEDPPDVFAHIIEFIQASGIVTAMVGLLSPVIGTRLYDRLQRAGRLLSDFDGDNTNLEVHFVPTMGIERLQQGFLKVVDTIYSIPNYYARLRQFLRDFSLDCPVRAPIRPQTIPILLQTLVRLGMFGEERWEFWSMVFWTLRYQPQKIRIALILAVMGRHHRWLFRELAEKTV
jgi:radical SAM superfamily enzyme YgiQ (UPF0313 family)